MTVADLYEMNMAWAEITSIAFRIVGEEAVIIRAPEMIERFGSRKVISFDHFSILAE